MPPQATSAQATLSLVGLLMISAILGAWTWAIGRLVSGRGLLPPTSLRVVPWRGTHVVGMLLLYLGLQIVLPPVVLGLIGVKPAPGAKLEPGPAILVTMAVNVTFLALGPLFLARWSGAGPADFGVARGKLGIDLFRGVLAWPLLAPIVFGVMFAATKIWPSGDEHPLKKMLEGHPAPSTWIFAGVSAAILAPLTEEFLFRGVLLGALGRWASGINRPKPAPATDPETSEPEIWYEPEPSLAPGHRGRFLAANVAVSVVFAAMHAPVWPTPVPLFFLSLGLGVLYQRTGGLVAPVALHATFNGISTLVFYLVLQANPKAAEAPALPPPEVFRTWPDLDAGGHPRPIRIET